MNKEETKIELVFDDESVDAVMAELSAAGASDLHKAKQLGLTGIETVIAAVAVASCLVNIVTRVLRLWKCGLIIDARLPKLRIEKNCDLPRGSVLILNLDGTKAQLDNVGDTQVKDIIAALKSSK